MKNKKRYLVFFTALTIMAFLLAACGEDEENDDLIGPDGTADDISWLTALKPGAWAEYTSPDGSRTRMEYFGEDTWQGRQCLLIEVEVTSSGETSIMQMWIDKATSEGVVTFMKMDDMVFKMEITQEPGTSEMPWEDDEVKTEKIGTGTYTTPTGKTVNVTKYLTTDSYGTNESWMSNEVPFGQVKEIYDGVEEMVLYDFGDSGAVRDISKQEAENAQSFGFPG